MDSKFEIVRIEPDGSCIRCENVATFQVAELTARTLAVCYPGKYLIFDHRTGEGTVMNLRHQSPTLPA